MPDQQDLKRLQAKHSTLTDALAAKVAEKEKLEEQIAAKRTAREDHAGDSRRHAELEKQLHELGREWRETRDRARKLERVTTKLGRRVRKVARQLRNAASPKVIDLAFDRTAVRPLVRQGAIFGSVGHYTAGPLDDDGDDESIALWRAYDRAHKAQGWAALGYNIGVTRLGTIVRLRGIEYVGAHTLNYNTGRVGISVHGTTGHTWTKAQKRGLRKALAKWGLDQKPVIGHHQAPGQSTACPGAFLAGYNAKGR